VWAGFEEEGEGEGEELSSLADEQRGAELSERVQQMMLPPLQPEPNGSRRRGLLGRRGGTEQSWRNRGAVA
jgi:hypothetical protein